MSTADSNPHRPAAPARTTAGRPFHILTYSAHCSYSPPSRILSSHPSRTPSPPDVTYIASSLGLSFRPPRASSPVRLADEDDGEHTQLCMCDPDASFASSATFCTCSHAGDHDEHPPPPDSPPSRRRGSTPAADTYSRRRSLEPSVNPSASRRPLLEPPHRISQPPSSTNRRPSAEASSAGHSSARAPVRYDGWIARVEGDVEAFEAAHPPRARPRPSTLESLYPSASTLSPGLRHPPTLESLYPSASALYPSALESRYPSASALDSLYPSGSTYSPGSRGRGGRGRTPTRHVSPAQHTLALMAERARLLGELWGIRAVAGRRTR